MSQLRDLHPATAEALAEVEADPGILARFNSAVINEFRANGGVVGGPFKDSAVMLLTMTGAKSGQQRMTPLEYFAVEDRVIIVGTRGGAETNPSLGAQPARQPERPRRDRHGFLRCGRSGVVRRRARLSVRERQRALSPDPHLPRAGEADPGLRGAADVAGIPG